MKKNGIVILDFGSQYNQLIARRVREMSVYAEVLPYHTPVADILAREPNGIILSGGPASVYVDGAPRIDKDLYMHGIPILAVCYGMQMTAHTFGGVVEQADKQEFGKTEFVIDDRDCPLFQGVPDKSLVWMSHNDHVAVLPAGARKLGHTSSCIAGFVMPDINTYCLQFHAEVTHSEYGMEIYENFVRNIAKCDKNWEMANFIEETIANIKKTVGDKKVIMALSGGVDSSVAATLIHRAIGDNLTCIFVDTGLLRKNEAKDVMEVYGKNFHMNIKCINAEDRYLAKLAGVTEPEQKRKIIGKEFIDIFDEEAGKITDADFLGQGTIYSDVIESSAVGAPSMTIKSHHNVGGLPKDMKFKLIEPLRELFKDEVRKVGRELGIPEHMIDRHPFPGPGLGIRILGEITKEKADILREADAIFIRELREADLYHKVTQAAVILLPVKSVGVMGDVRTYEYTAVLRAVNTIDFMTATWSKLPLDFLEKVSNRILNEVKGINRLTYDISSKPPATVEWE